MSDMTDRPTRLRARADIARREARFGDEQDFMDAADEIERMQAAAKSVVEMWDAEDHPIPLPNLRRMIDRLRAALEHPNK